ncbi:hypothetical protein FA09DRAFT_71458 [Tilletiopsis washingtonensis]|uniref:Uncharacterized protein n=1 Tax=Tilletiopsis washingtonensis TaxID=58919 RepID=A0A316Z6I8_9BASI|nr:hypothetical protein FA09DRAFT_71458 [Tilletiopsis washingtonensis]PWN96896.1 hypothetical protein FA09DRAFT_71458 [Tilletiopsis washingtonensis]
MATRLGAQPIRQQRAGRSRFAKRVNTRVGANHGKKGKKEGHRACLWEELGARARVGSACVRREGVRWGKAQEPGGSAPRRRGGQGRGKGAETGLVVHRASLDERHGSGQVGGCPGQVARARGGVHTPERHASRLRSVDRVTERVLGVGRGGTRERDSQAAWWGKGRTPPVATRRQRRN